MAKIYIEPAKAKATLSQQMALERALQALSQNVGGIRRGLNYKISGREMIDARLRDAINQLNKEADSAKAMRTGLEQIITRYEQTENSNTDRVAAEKTSIQSTGNAGSTQPSTDSSNSANEGVGFDWPKLLKKEFLNLIGPFGTLYSGVEGLVTGKPGNSAKNFLKLIGKGGSLAIDAKATWFEDLFGWGKSGLKMVDESNLPDFWKKLGDFSSPGKTFGTVVSWGASFADSLFKNLTEFGSDAWSNIRFWGETFIEGGIDILEGAAVAAAVGAGIVAVFGSAPALAIGGATILGTMVVDWGLNNVVSWLTNGAQTDWKEAVSDLICDTTEKIVDAVGPVVTKVVDKGKEVIDKGVEFAKDTGKAIGDTIDKGVKWVKGLFGGNRNKVPASSGGGIW